MAVAAAGNPGDGAKILVRTRHAVPPVNMTSIGSRANTAAVAAGSAGNGAKIIARAGHAVLPANIASAGSRINLAEVVVKVTHAATVQHCDRRTRHGGSNRVEGSAMSQEARVNPSNRTVRGTS